MKDQNPEPSHTEISQPQVEGQTSQTGNAGTPLQVENVQYNMKIKPVESKVGLYLKIAGIGLWFTAIFVGIFLASIFSKMAGSSEDVGEQAVFTLALSTATVPMFLIANSKLTKELASKPTLTDDLFFKKSTRSNLTASIIFTAIALITFVYNLLSKLFLQTGKDIKFDAVVNALVFVALFGAIVAYYWNLHKTTHR